MIQLTLLPFASCLGAWAYWLSRDEPTGVFVGYLLALPVIYSVCVVSLAQRFGLWKWSRPLGRAVFVNTGLAQLVFLITAAWVERETSVASFLLAGGIGAISYAAIGTLYDVVGLDRGYYVVYNRAHLKKQGPIASALSYGFAYFGALGFGYGALAKLGHVALVERTPPEPFLAAAGVGALLLPFLTWIFVMRASRRNVKRASSKAG